MKGSAIARIIIFSVVIILLVGILLAGLGIGMLSFNIDLSSGDYITGNGSVDAAEVEDLKIEWAAGDIKVITADTDSITFTESYFGDDSQQMVYALNGRTLTIRYSKPAIQIGILSTSPSKDLTVTVPEDWFCRELSIDAASTNAEIEDLTIQKVDIDSASNTFHFNNCEIAEMDIDGASNDLYLTGALERMDCDGMSNSITAQLTQVPAKIDLDGMSTVLDITLPPDSGFRVEMDGLSCQFDSDFDYSNAKGCYIYGDQACYIQADGMSCEINIRKGE